MIRKTTICHCYKLAFVLMLFTGKVNAQDHFFGSKILNLDTISCVDSADYVTIWASKIIGSWANKPEIRRVEIDGSSYEDLTILSDMGDKQFVSIVLNKQRKKALEIGPEVAIDSVYLIFWKPYKITSVKIDNPRIRYLEIISWYESVLLDSNVLVNAENLRGFGVYGCFEEVLPLIEKMEKLEYLFFSCFSDIELVVQTLSKMPHLKEVELYHEFYANKLSKYKDRLGDIQITYYDHYN